MANALLGISWGSSETYLQIYLRLLLIQKPVIVLPYFIPESTLSGFAAPSVIRRNHRSTNEEWVMIPLHGKLVIRANKSIDGCLKSQTTYPCQAWQCHSCKWEPSSVCCLKVFSSPVPLPSLPAATTRLPPKASNHCSLAFCLVTSRSSRGAREGDQGWGWTRVDQATPRQNNNIAQTFNQKETQKKLNLTWKRGLSSIEAFIGWCWGRQKKGIITFAIASQESQQCGTELYFKTWKA